MVGAIVKTYNEYSNPVKTNVEEVHTNVDQQNKVESEVHEKSYLEEVYSNPFFEDPSDMWLSSSREEESLLKKKQKSKLKLKLKKHKNK